jgi:hypothetical protein
MFHICGEEIAMAMGLLTGSGTLYRYLRTRWLAVHKCANSSTGNSAAHGEEGSDSTCPHDHSKDDQGANSEGRLYGRTEDAAS